MERYELIRTVAAVVFVAVVLVMLAWQPVRNLIRAVLRRLHQKGAEPAMYSWVVPPGLLSRLWENRQQTATPIARQIREAVEAYLSRVEARPAAAGPEAFEESKRGGVSL